MKNDKAVDQMVKFVFWKLHKPGRLATPAAVRDARYAAQDILNLGFGPLHVMEIFTFLDDEPEVNPRTGFDESFGWWKGQVNDLPSLAVALQKPRFVAQYEARAGEAKKFRDAKGFSDQDWVDDMTAPRPEDNNYEERKKRRAQKRFTEYLENPESLLKTDAVLLGLVKDNKTTRDRNWKALVVSYTGEQGVQQLYDFLRTEMTPEGLAYVFEEGHDPLARARIGMAARICEAEAILPYKARVDRQTFTSEAEIQAQKQVNSFRDITTRLQEIVEGHGWHQDESGAWFDETGKPTGRHSMRL
jgi:hypothetical protein